MLFERIVSDPEVLDGQPCVRGTRLTVRRVLIALSTYPNHEELFKDYPALHEEDIKQVLEYAAAMVADKEIQLSTGT